MFDYNIIDGYQIEVTTNCNTAFAVLSGRVNNVLTVVKENDFTSYNTDVEII